MQRGQNYYGIMLVCVLVLTVGTIFMLAQAPANINASISQSQNHLGGGIKDIVSASGTNLLVLSRTGNVAHDSPMPCCANPGIGGCANGVGNCTYAKGSGLSCFSQLFDTKSGLCAQ